MTPILAGEFKMGIGNSVHKVYLDAFYIDIHEVTNAQYKQFVDENPEWSKKPSHNRYYHSRYLARWHGNNYPIGKGNSPCCLCELVCCDGLCGVGGQAFANRGGVGESRTGWLGIGQNFLAWTPTGISAPNPYGLHGVVNQVWEWCLDEYDRPFYKNSLRENPVAGAGSIRELTNGFMSVKGSRVVRGGSCYDGYARRVDRTNTHPADNYSHISFRCVMPIIP